MNLSKFKDIQLPLAYKKKMSDFIIKNDFTKVTVKKNISAILKKIQISSHFTKRKYS